MLARLKALEYVAVMGLVGTHPLCWEGAKALQTMAKVGKRSQDL